MHPALPDRHDDRTAPCALTAGDIAKSAEFFSFGTNDLTQTTYGLSAATMSRPVSSRCTWTRAFGCRRLSIDVEGGRPVQIAGE